MARSTFDSQRISYYRYTLGMKLLWGYTSEPGSAKENAKIHPSNIVLAFIINWSRTSSPQSYDTMSAIKVCSRGDTVLLGVQCRIDNDAGRAVATVEQRIELSLPSKAWIWNHHRYDVAIPSDRFDFVFTKKALVRRRLELDLDWRARVADSGVSDCTASCAVARALP